MGENMKKLKTTIAASGLGLLLFTVVGAAQSLAAAPALTRTHSGGGVTAKVTYLNPQSTEDARFEISFDTHSVDLDSYDLKALSSLRDDAGKAYQPTKVENKGSGHHRRLVLVFPKLARGNKRLELVVKDVAGVKERSFVWDLQ
jgi:hypothetical protein